VIRSAVSDTRSLYADAAVPYLVVGGAVFLLVVTALAVLLVRFRAGRDPERRPGRRHEAPGLERAYALVLAVVTAGLMVLTFHSQVLFEGITRAAGRDPRSVRVDVIGAQWQWRFRYPGSPVVEQTAPEGTPPELIVPVGRRVLFHGRSQDVLHDFWIPDLRFQRQVWPDHTERWALVFPHAGRYVGVCAWFCGLYHQSMHFVAVAVAPARFDAWLARRRAEARR
jgi:cytochrome c oxidase subunit 2